MLSQDSMQSLAFAVVLYDNEKHIVSSVRSAKGDRNIEHKIPAAKNARLHRSWWYSYQVIKHSLQASTMVSCREKLPSHL
jgi:hypothetical protein